MNPAKDTLASIHGIAILAFLRAQGGQATMHARDFGIDRGDYFRAIRRLQIRGDIECIGDCKWRLAA